MRGHVQVHGPFFGSLYEGSCSSPWSFFLGPYMRGHFKFISGAPAVTVNIMDSRSIFRLDIGFYVGIVFDWPCYSPYMGSMCFWPTRHVVTVAHA